MKRFKNNKGVTGVDIAVSVSIIVITLGIVMAIYTSYSNKSKEIKRNSVATNLAMTVIEHIETTDINHSDIASITPTGKPIDNGYGITNKPNGYTITAKKIENENVAINKVAFQIDVIVSYTIQDEIKTVTLSTIKKYDNTKEAEPPKIADGKIIVNKNGGSVQEITGVIPVKYDSAKGGYVKTQITDSEWYSISSRKFPVVVKIDENAFGVDSKIQLAQASNRFVWIPYYGIEGTNKFRYCDSEGNIIKYQTNTDKISSYKISNTKVTPVYGGMWIEVDKDLKVTTNSSTFNNIYENVRMKIFSWD